MHPIEHGIFGPTKTRHHSMECTLAPVPKADEIRFLVNSFTNLRSSVFTYVGFWALHWWIYCAIKLSSALELCCSTTSWNFRRISGLVFCTTHWPYEPAANQFCVCKKKKQFEIFPYWTNAIECFFKLLQFLPARRTHNGFTFPYSFAMARTQSGAAISAGFSGNPHGSANIKCFTLLCVPEYSRT